jgi:hypothetical protein
MRSFRTSNIFVWCRTTSTHTSASLYETFPPAKHAVSCNEWNFITRAIHGNWLHMAERAILECTALSRRGDREVALQRQAD